MHHLVSFRFECSVAHRLALTVDWEIGYDPYYSPCCVFNSSSFHVLPGQHLRDFLAQDLRVGKGSGKVTLSNVVFMFCCTQVCENPAEAKFRGRIFDLSRNYPATRDAIFLRATFTKIMECKLDCIQGTGQIGVQDPQGGLFWLPPSTKFATVSGQILKVSLAHLHQSRPYPGPEFQHWVSILPEDGDEEAVSNTASCCAYFVTSHFHRRPTMRHILGPGVHKHERSNHPVLCNLTLTVTRIERS